MSHYMTALAMKQTGLKPATKIVLYWLADHHNGETGKCFPSLNRLASLAEMDKSTVVRHIDALVELGLVDRVHSNRNDGGYSSTNYILKLNDPLSQNATSPCSKLSTPLVAKCDTNLGSNNLGNRTNYIFDNFDDIWGIYPKKQGKGAAKKAYEKAMKKIDPNILLDRIKAYVEAIQNKDLQYIPMLSTWLNQERWGDDLPQSYDVDHNFRTMVNDLARVQR